MAKKQERPWDEGKVKRDTGASTKEGQPTRREQLDEDPIGFKKGKLNIVWRPPAEQKQDAEDEFEENEHKRDRFGRFTRGSFSPAPMAQPDLSKQRLVKAFRAQGRKLDPSLSTGELHRAAKTKAELFHQPGKPDHIRKHSLPSHNLSRGLLEALNRYTEEAWGKDVSYYTMNKALKAGELPSDDPDSELSTEIDSVQAALLALPPYQHSGPDAALYRSMARYGKRSGKELVSDEFLQAYEDAVGDVIQDPAFVSTSNTVDGATAFGRGKGGVMFVVKSDPNAQGESVGRDIKPYSQAPEENEILFPHGAYFKVAGVYRGEGRTPLPPPDEPDDDYMDLLDDEDFLDLSDDEDPIFVSSDPMVHIIDYRDKALDAMGAGHLKDMVHNGMVRRSRIDATLDLRIYGNSPRLFKDLDEDERVRLLVQGMYGVKTQEDALARLKNMAPGDETEEYISEVDARKKGILALGKKGYICAAEVVMELENRKALGKPDFDDDPNAHGSSKQYARDKVADMYTKSAMSYLESSLTTVDDDDAIVSDPDKFLARSEKILEHFDQNPKLLGDMSVTELYDYIDKAGSDLMAYLPGLGDYMTPKALTALSDGRMTPEIEDAVKFIDGRKQVVRALGTDAARLIARTYAAVWKNPDLGQYPDPLNAKIPPKAKRVLPPELQYLNSYPEIDESVSVIVLEEVNAKFTSSFKRGRKDAEGLPLALGPQIMADFILGADPLTDIQDWTELEVLQEGGALASFLLSEYLPGAEGRWDTIVAPDVLRRVILSADPMVNISPWDEAEVAGEAQAILTFLMEEYRRSSIEDLLKTPADYIPQDAAQYTESSTEPEATCKECFAYLDTRRCRIVLGHISPYGRCALWESATPRFVNRNDDDKPVQRIVDWQGLKLGLQYLPGDIRHEKRITAAYGHVRGTYGQADDGMAFDVWVNLEGGDRCFKLQQLTDEGEHDEFKYILGASSLEDAKAIYAANMPSRLMGEVVECEVDELAPVVKRKDADEPWDEDKVVRGKGGKFAKKPAAVERPIGTPEQQNPSLSQGPRSLFVQDCANGCSYGKSSDAEVRAFMGTSIIRSQQAQKYIKLHRQSRAKWIDDAINELQAEAQRLVDEYKASLHPIYSQVEGKSLGHGGRLAAGLNGARRMHGFIAEDDPTIGDFDEDSFLERTIRKENKRRSRVLGDDSSEEAIQREIARAKADLSAYREAAKAIESGEIEEKSESDVEYRILNLEEEAKSKVPRLQSVDDEITSLEERKDLEDNGDPENPRDAMQFFGDSEKMMSYIKGHSTQNIRTTEDSEGEILQLGVAARRGPVLDIELLASDALSCPSKIKDEAIAAAKFCTEMPGATNALRAEALEFIEEMESSKRYQGFASGVFLEGAIGEAYLRGIDTITCNPIDRNIRLFERAGFKDDGDHHILAPDDAWKFWEARKTMGQRKDAISKSDADAWMADLAKLEAELGPMMCGGSKTRADAGLPWDEKKVVRGKGGKFAKKPAPAAAPQQKKVDRPTAKTETIKAVEGWLAKKLGGPEVVREANQSLKLSLSKGRVMTRTDIKGLIGILNDAAIKTQFETWTSNGSFDPTARFDCIHHDAETSMFDARGEIEDFAKAPVYGYFDSGDDTEFHSMDENGVVQRYGRFAIEIDEPVKGRTTFTGGDSLAKAYLPSSATDPSISSVIRFENANWAVTEDPEDEWDESVFVDKNKVKQIVENPESVRDVRVGSYVEAQIHGGVGLSDIKAIHYDIKSSSIRVIGSVFSNSDYMENSSNRLGEFDELNTFLDTIESHRRVSGVSLPFTIREKVASFDDKMPTSDGLQSMKRIFGMGGKIIWSYEDQYLEGNNDVEGIVKEFTSEEDVKAHYDDLFERKRKAAQARRAYR